MEEGRACRDTRGRSPSPQLAPRYTVQSCIGGESMVTCVRLTDFGMNPVSLETLV